MIAAIVNPVAGGGAARRQWPDVARMLGPAKVWFTERPGHATELARRIECDVLIVAGGDGTLNEVVNGVGTSRCAPRLAFVPMGRGGDFARTLGISGIAQAVEAIVRGGRRPVDVFRAKFGGGERLFVNAASIGLGAVAARDAEKWRALPGRVRYLAAAVPTLAAGRSFRVRVRVDDAPSESFDVTTVAIANGQYQGSGIRIAPEARLDDGLADVTVVERVSLFEVAKRLPILYNGAIHSHPRVLHRRGRVVRVEAEGGVPLELDGQVIGTLPVEVDVLPGALSIISPAGASRRR